MSTTVKHLIAQLSHYPDDTVVKLRGFGQSPEDDYDVNGFLTREHRDADGNLVSRDPIVLSANYYGA